MISLGNNEISFIALGDTEISNAFKGDAEVYANANDNMPPFIASDWVKEKEMAWSGSGVSGDGTSIWFWNNATTGTDNYQLLSSSNRNFKNKNYSNVIFRYKDSKNGYYDKGHVMYVFGSNTGLNFVQIGYKNNAGFSTTQQTTIVPISGNYKYLRIKVGVHRPTARDDDGMRVNYTSIEFAK